MNFRACLHIITVTFSLLGLISYQQDAVVPNQEIVLEFSDTSINESDTEQTVKLIKSQLEKAGVDGNTFRVQKAESGEVVISYFSKSNIAKIKSLLSENTTLSLEITTEDSGKTESNFPTEDSLKTYNVQVLEIQNGHDVSAGIAGKLALEKAGEHNRFVNPNSYVPQSFNVEEVNRMIDVAQQFNKKEVLSIDEACYIIPEVRAGPNQSILKV